MNIVVNGFTDSRQKGILDWFKEQVDFENIFFILSDEMVNANKSSDRFHYFSVDKIVKGHYLSDSQYPLDRGLIDFFHLEYHKVFNMMNRYEVYEKYEKSFELKKSIIYRQLAFWNTIYLNCEFSYYVSSNIPHDIYDFIIYVVCKYYRKTKFLFFHQLQQKDTIIALEDIGDFQFIQKQYDKILRDNNPSIFLDEYFQKIWKRNSFIETPFYMRKRKTSNKRILKLLKKALFNKQNLKSLQYEFKSKKLKREYINISRKADLSKKYFYLPLHYQPELTTTPIGDCFTEQYLQIKYIDSLLPDDYFLYVKEHPKQKLANRYFGYYNDILKETSKTFFIHSDESSFELIRHSQAVATVTGTAGWEALFMKKPSLIFGNVFFQNAPGIYHIRNLDDCRKAINEVVKGKFCYNEILLKSFIKAVDDTCIRGIIDTLYESQSEISLHDSNHNIINYMNSIIFREKV